jgi:ubiquinone/menaquinone biosynthesis C-methylase UbiE
MTDLTPNSFFDLYADEYDIMTDVAAREPKHRTEIQALIKAYAPTSVLDAGCGTGLTSQMFAESGIQVVGIDASSEMVRLSEARCERFGDIATFQTARFEGLPKTFAREFDLVVCLANSLSGLSSSALVARALKQFRRVLRPGGTLVVQMLNPDRMKSGEPLVIKVSRHGDIVYHRYALRIGKTVSLHIIRTDLSALPPSFQPFVHTYEPLSMRELTTMMSAVGFGRIRRWGNLSMSSRFTSQDRDMVITAVRIS